MNAYEAIIKRRTVRKFKQEQIPLATLHKLINAARLAPSGANMQPLKYIIVNDEKEVSQINPLVKWAAYISRAGKPGEGENPVAYIVILVDTQIKKSGYELDLGAAAQNILIAATEEGIGTCWMGAIDRDSIGKVLNIPEQYLLNTVIALGYEAEQPINEDESGSIQYYKDTKGVLHVPKRKLEDVIVNFK